MKPIKTSEISWGLGTGMLAAYAFAQDMAMPTRSGGPVVKSLPSSTADSCQLQKVWLPIRLHVVLVPSLRWMNVLLPIWFAVQVLPLLSPPKVLLPMVLEL
jgi:hypothetical protein